MIFCSLVLSFAQLKFTKKGKNFNSTRWEANMADIQSETVQLLSRDCKHKQLTNKQRNGILQYLLALKKGKKLPKGAINETPTVLDVSRLTVSRIWREAQKQYQSAVLCADVSSTKQGNCGRKRKGYSTNISNIKMFRWTVGALPGVCISLFRFFHKMVPANSTHRRSLTHTWFYCWHLKLQTPTRRVRQKLACLNYCGVTMSRFAPEKEHLRRALLFFISSREKGCEKSSFAGRNIWKARSVNSYMWVMVLTI